MDDAAVMCVRHRVNDLDGVVQHPLERQSVAVRDRGRERHACDMLHDDERPAVHVAHLVHAADGRVHERGGHARFPQQPLDGARSPDRRIEDLDRHRTEQPPISGEVDHACAAGAEHRLDAIGPKALTDGHWLHEPEDGRQSAISQPRETRTTGRLSRCTHIQADRK